MKALRLYGPRDAKVENVPDPQPLNGWCLIKTVCVGICGTDKAFYTGSYPLFKRPLIPGHEVVGIVVEGCRELQGTLVVPEINFACLRCPTCLAGLYTHCPNKKTLGIDFDGGFAEYFIAPPWALHEVHNMDPGLAVFIEPLAALVHGLRLYPLPPASRCAIVGTGTLSYMLTQLLLNAGHSVVVLARVGSPKARHFKDLGARVANANDVEPSSFDAVFDVTGSTEAISLAIDLARPRGLVHVKSTPGGIFRVDMTKAVVKELRIVGTRCGRYEDFELAKKLLEEGRVRPPPATIIKGLERSVEAFEVSLRREVFKVLVFP